MSISYQEETGSQNWSLKEAFAELKLKTVAFSVTYHALRKYFEKLELFEGGGGNCIILYLVSKLNSTEMCLVQLTHSIYFLNW